MAPEAQVARVPSAAQVELEPSRDACMKTNCGNFRVFCLCLPDGQMDEYKRQLKVPPDGLAGVLSQSEDRPVLKQMQSFNSKSLRHPLILALQQRTAGSASKEVEDALRTFEKLFASGNTREMEEKFVILARQKQIADYLCPLHLDSLRLPVVERHKDLALSYGKRIENGLIEWYSVGDYADCDLVTGLATYLEVDLTHKFYEHLETAKEIGKSDAYQSIWHIATKNKSAQKDICEDKIYRYQVVDALDDTDGCVLLLVWTLMDQTPAPERPAPGFERSGCECTIYRFLPFWEPSTRRCNGFRLARANISGPSQDFYQLVAGYDHEALRQSARIGNENFYAKFRSHVRSRQAELENRMKVSPRARLYDQVRTRLQKAPEASPGKGPSAIEVVAGYSFVPEAQAQKEKMAEATHDSLMKRLGAICHCACGSH